MFGEERTFKSVWPGLGSASCFAVPFSYPEIGLQPERQRTAGLLARAAPTQCAHDILHSRLRAPQPGFDGGGAIDTITLPARLSPESCVMHMQAPAYGQDYQMKLHVRRVPMRLPTAGIKAYGV